MRKISNSKKPKKESFINIKDDLLMGITYEDLIDTINSNEPIKNSRVVEKVFDELLKINIHDAKYELKQNMDFILSQVESY